MGTNTLIIKDGNSVASALSMISSSTGLIPEHSITGTVNTVVSGTTSVSLVPIASYTNKRVAFPNNADLAVTSGWIYSNNSGSFLACTSSLARKSLIIFNKSYDLPAYILVGASNTSGSTQYGFTILSTGSSPETYSFILEASGTYFGDSSVSSLAHAVFIPSASSAINSQIAVTEVI